MNNINDMDNMDKMKSIKVIWKNYCFIEYYKFKDKTFYLFISNKLYRSVNK